MNARFWFYTTSFHSHKADPIIESAELRHDQEELSKCCSAPLTFHWPCDLKLACSKCRDCAECGTNHEREGIQEAERRKRR